MLDVKEVLVTIIDYNYVGTSTIRADEQLTSFTRDPGIVNQFNRCSFRFRKRLGRLHYIGHELVQMI